MMCSYRSMVTWLHIPQIFQLQWNLSNLSLTLDQELATYTLQAKCGSVQNQMWFCEHTVVPTVVPTQCLTLIMTGAGTQVT